MGLIKCKECGSKISNTAKKCPKCGTRTLYAKKISDRISFIIAISIGLTIGIYGCCCAFNLIGVNNSKIIGTWEYKKITTSILKDDNSKVTSIHTYSFNKNGTGVYNLVCDGMKISYDTFNYKIMDSGKTLYLFYSDWYNESIDDYKSCQENCGEYPVKEDYEETYELSIFDDAIYIAGDMYKKLNNVL